MKQVYLIPNIITAFALACGLFVIFKVNMVEPGSGNYQMLQASVILLLVAAIADLFDGAVARLLRAESDFGVLFDSLSDAICFGVAPSVLLLKTLSLEQGTGLSFFAVISALFYSICGVLRLVRFSVKAHETKGNAEQEAAHKKHFTGLPIPVAALSSVSANLFLASPLREKLFAANTTLDAIILSCLSLFIGYLMVSRWKFPSMKSLHVRVASFQLVFFTAIAAFFVLYGILYFFPMTLLILTWGYVIIAIVLAVIRLIAGKKSKTLEEFEPDEEDIE